MELSMEGVILLSGTNPEFLMCIQAILADCRFCWVDEGKTWGWAGMAEKAACHHADGR